MADSVKIRRQPIKLPIVPLAAPDPNPALPSVGYRSIYPYTRLYRFGSQPVERTLTALELENDFLQLQVLPELGGRMWRAINRANGLDLLHHPERVGMVNFGLRGAWFTGGIEFNFPNSHSVTSASPIPALTRGLPDGGASIVVGNLDLAWRVSWSVGIRMEPNSSSIHFDVLLNNRTSFPVRFWWWINAGIPADPSLEYVNATTEVLPHFMGRREHRPEPVSWPVHDGRDLRWYGKYVEPTSLFQLAGDDRWFGYYMHRLDQGLVRIGSSADAPGLKFWNSGASEEGFLWGSQMTCGERYANTELQSGRPETQTDYGVLPPHHVLLWTEDWRPVWGLGGLTCASEAVALHIVDDDAASNVRLLSDRARSECTVEVTTDQTRTIPCDLAAYRPIELDLPPWPGDAPLQIRVRDVAGNVLLDYDRIGDRARRSVLADVLQIRSTFARTPSELTVEELALEADRLMRSNLPGPARIMAERALALDPGHIASHLLLAWQDVREGRHESARQHCLRILWRNPRHEWAHFVLALSELKSGNAPQAEIEFERTAGQGYAVSAAAWFHLGQLYLARRRWEQAVDAFEKCLVHEGNHVKALALRYAALRRAGETARAREALIRASDVAPLDPLVRAETWLAGSRSAVPFETHDDLLDLRPRSERIQDALEVVCDYMACGLVADAQAVLKAQLAASDTVPNSLALYYAGYLCDKTGDSARAMEYWDRAAQCSREDAFSFRSEDTVVLKTALGMRPDDGLAHYLLGLLESYHNDPESARPNLERAHALMPDWDQPLRLLALCGRLQNDTQAARSFLWQAIAVNPRNPSSYIELDDLLVDEGASVDERMRLWENRPAEILDDDRARGHYADALLKAGRYELALGLLARHTFFPEEGSDYYRDLFVQAHLALGIDALKALRLDAALAHARLAATYPPNLGIAAPFIRYDAAAYLLEAAVLSTRGERERARETLERAAAERHRELNEAEFSAALALRLLGRTDEARARLEALVAKGENDLAWPDRDHAYAGFLCNLARAALTGEWPSGPIATVPARYQWRFALYARLAEGMSGEIKND